MKKVGDLEDLVETTMFKVASGETEFTKTAQDMEQQLQQLTSKEKMINDKGEEFVSFKVRLNKFMAEMHSWLSIAKKNQDCYIYITLQILKLTVAG